MNGLRYETTDENVATIILDNLGIGFLIKTKKGYAVTVNGFEFFLDWKQRSQASRIILNIYRMDIEHKVREFYGTVRKYDEFKIEI